MSKDQTMVQVLRNVLDTFEETGMTDDAVLEGMAKVLTVVIEGRAAHARVVAGITVGPAIVH